MGDVPLDLDRIVSLRLQTETDSRFVNQQSSGIGPVLPGMRRCRAGWCGRIMKNRNGGSVSALACSHREARSNWCLPPQRVTLLRPYRYFGGKRCTISRPVGSTSHDQNHCHAEVASTRVSGQTGPTPGKPELRTRSGWSESSNGTLLDGDEHRHDQNNQQFGGDSGSDGEGAIGDRQGIMTAALARPIKTIKNAVGKCEYSQANRGNQSKICDRSAARSWPAN